MFVQISSGDASLGLNWDVCCSFKILSLRKALNNNQTIYMYLKCENTNSLSENRIDCTKESIWAALFYFLLLLYYASRRSQLLIFHSDLLLCNVTVP